MRAFSVEDILKWAEDNASAVDAQHLARTEYWQELGTDGVMIWGTLRNPKHSPVVIRLPLFGLHRDAVHCPCNQRKPCEHSLALMLLWLQTPEVFTTEAAPLPSLNRSEQLSGEPILSMDAAIRDRWLVIGVSASVLIDLSPEELIWLYGLNTRRVALLHSVGDAAVMHIPPLAVGQVIDAELVYSPSPTPLKASLSTTHGHAHYEPLSEPVGETIPAAIASNPRLHHYPLVLRNVYVTRFGKGWTIRDAGGQFLRITPQFTHQWALYALHAGIPIQISGVWDGEMIFPLSVYSENRWIDLNTLLPYKRNNRSITQRPVSISQGVTDPVLDPFPLPPRAAPETQPVCSPRAMRHLSLLLSGTYGVLLKEWLITAAHANRRVSPEVLPTLLSLGLQRAHLQPYLMPVIGERGDWLAAEIRNQNWRWVFDPEIPHFQVALKQEREQERAFIETIAKTQFTLVVQNLARYRTPWSMTLMDVFLGTMERIERPPHWKGWWSLFYLNHLTPLMFFFPLNSYGETQRRFQQSRAFGDEAIHHRLQIVGDFRRDLFDALQENEVLTIQRFDNP